MHFTAIIASAAALFTLSSAAPQSAVKRADLQALCPAGATYYGPQACSSGFVGCLAPTNAAACNRAKKFDPNSCDGFGTFYRCSSNGWAGCATEDICNKPATTGPSGPTPPVATPPVATPSVATPPVATPPVATPPVVTPPLATSPECPAGSVYIKRNQCKTGFVGCISSTVPCADYCDGLNGQNYQGWCPFGSGIFLSCYKNGFYGCTTDIKKCD